MSDRVVLVDLAIAVLVAAVLLIVSPGVAVVAIVVAIVLVVLGADALVRRVSRGRSRGAARASDRRPPRGGRAG